MNTSITAAIITVSLFGAVLVGMRLRRFLPEHHLGEDTRDTVKLAMGLVATMSALLLGLLVSSAKGTYDAERTQVIQMAGKVAFLDRVLTVYGPDTLEARTLLRATVQDVVRQIWPNESGIPAQSAANFQAGNAFYGAIQRLSPRDDTQRSLKTHAADLAIDIGQLRSLVMAQSVASISTPLLVVLVCWLVAIFLSFSLLAPPNATATLALLVSAFSVAAAIFLILELDRPFGGLIQISSEPLLKALTQLGN
jgi:hypothetical protein